MVVAYLFQTGKNFFNVNQLPSFVSVTRLFFKDFFFFFFSKEDGGGFKCVDGVMRSFIEHGLVL